MKNKFFSYSIFVAVILVGMYIMWPLPFLLLSQKVILPTAEKTGDFIGYMVSPFSIFTKVNQLAKDNKSLQEENQRLLSGINATAQKEDTCSTISSELNSLGLKSKTEVLARVIGRTPESANQFFVIDKGADDGMKVGQPVVSNGFLVGQIDQVNSRESTVKLLTSSASAIPAVLSRSGEIGLIQGGIEGLFMTEISSASKIQSGEPVMTSGIGGLIPEGIQIGQVATSNSDNKDVFQSIKITSPVKFIKIKIISVLT